MIAHDASGQTHLVWGSDRFPILADILGLLFTYYIALQQCIYILYISFLYVDLYEVTTLICYLTDFIEAHLSTLYMYV